MKNIPIKLEFILQKNAITIGELERIYNGQTLPCNVGFEKNIIIQANGVTVAHGELVLIDDRPAVIISDLGSRHAGK